MHIECVYRFENPWSNVLFKIDFGYVQKVVPIGFIDGRNEKEQKLAHTHTHNFESYCIFYIGIHTTLTWHIPRIIISISYAFPHSTETPGNFLFKGVGVSGYLA